MNKKFFVVILILSSLSNNLFSYYQWFRNDSGEPIKIKAIYGNCKDKEATLSSRKGSEIDLGIGGCCLTDLQVWGPFTNSGQVFPLSAGICQGSTTYIRSIDAPEGKSITVEART